MSPSRAIAEDTRRRVETLLHQAKGSREYQPATSVELARQAIGLLADGSDAALAADCYLQLANALDLLGQHEEGLDACDEARRRFSAAGDRLGVAKAMRGRGAFMRSLGSYAQAVAALQESIASLEGLSEPSELGRSLQNLAVVMSELRFDDRALALTERAIECFTEAGDFDDGMLFALNDLLLIRIKQVIDLRAHGSTSGNQNLYQAIAQASAALDRLPPGPRSRIALALELTRAWALDELGHHEHAAANLDIAIPRIRDLGAPSLLARALRKRAELHLKAGERDKALSVVQEAAHLTVASGAEKAETLRTTALIQHECGNDEAAYHALRHSLAISTVHVSLS